MARSEPLNFEEVTAWLAAAVGETVNVHVVNESGTVGFLDGPIDSVMRFETEDSHGLIVDGAAGAWTLDLAEPEFTSSWLNAIAGSETHTQLRIEMRNHGLAITPAFGPDGEPGAPPQ